MIGVFRVTTTFAAKSLLRLPIVGMSVRASCALLRGLVGVYFKPSFASTVQLVLEENFEDMPTHVENGLVEA